MQLYAIIKTGGTEYRVTPGGSIKVDRMEAEPGAAIELDSVCKLVNGDQVAEGTPSIPGALVRARVKKHGQDNGVIVFKMGRRQLYRKKQDRQWQYTVLKIDEIVYEDNSFSKRDADPRKIRKAMAAAEAARPREARRPVRPVRPAKPEVVAKPRPVVAPAPPPKPVPAAVPASVPRQSRSAKPSAGKWLGLLALLLLVLLGFVFWQRTPTPAVTADIESPVAADIRLLNTRKIGRPADPAQPPD